MAGEPETLDLDDEPLARRLARHHYDRLLMLSDGVFAIAITLLALELRPPEHWSGGLWDLLVERWRALFGYVFGFLIVGAFWFSHATYSRDCGGSMLRRRRCRCCCCCSSPWRRQWRRWSRSLDRPRRCAPICC